MDRLLITGINGFVGHHMLELLQNVGSRSHILGVLKNAARFRNKYKKLNVTLVELDLNDRETTYSTLRNFRPDCIIHLASNSSVAYSWKNPVESFQNNTNIFLNLLESVRELKLSCRILSIGSSEEYGIVPVSAVPLVETREFNPISPYAVARVSQELLSKVYSSGYGLDIIMTRSFNHIGPGQKDTFVISSFAKQIAHAKKESAKSIRVGDLNIVRDFLDVRDVVKAYLMLIEKGKKGEVYNVCKGVGHSLKEILSEMLEIAGMEIEMEVDLGLLRPSDNPVIIGCNEKIRRNCGWIPKIDLRQSLVDILGYWERVVVCERNP